ncbi:MAG TPA: phosphatidate cytidylyltransferase [Burkholderiaceae bacterium]|nr:phosphatidate cytidylyltransferase [Burkholderiaceae bacterium]HQR69966.1 phosphatidate cytidylyltransferase [Burkholderiaceae bacterium]
MNLNLNETFLAVFVALATLSAVATGVGQWAARRTIDAERLARIGVLNSRVRGSWSVLAVFTIAFALGPAALLVVFALASFFALREFLSLTPIKASDHWALIVAFYVVIPAQYILLGFGRASVFATFIPVYVFLLLPVLVAIRQDTERFLERVAKVQWGLMISVYCISHAPAIATLPIRGYEGRGPLLLLYFLLVLFLTDLLQIVFSAVLDGRALRSNPNKTVWGVLAGSACGAVIGTALWWMTPFAWWQAFIMSLVIVGTGYLGSVVLSSVKQSLGARQWDTELELTRGVLERLDSLTFAAPLFWQITRYFWVIRADV